jgi:hypothetical protein
VRAVVGVVPIDTEPAIGSVACGTDTAPITAGGTWGISKNLSQEYDVELNTIFDKKVSPVIKQEIKVKYINNCKVKNIIFASIFRIISFFHLYIFIYILENN